MKSGRDRLGVLFLTVFMSAVALQAQSANAASINWTQETPTSLWPDFTAWLVMPYDPVSRQIFLNIGPPSGTQGIYATDFYFYNAATNIMTRIGGTSSPVDGCPADTPTLPGDRHPEHILTDTKRNFIWLFGGVNVFCGIGSVTTNGTSVTWAPSPAPYVSAPFTTDGTLNNQPIVINGVTYTIASVQDNQHLTLTTSAGVQSSPVYYSVTTGSGTNPRRDMYYLTLHSDPTTDVWTEVFPATIPNAYNYSGVQYDPDDDVIFLYGGNIGGRGDNWVYCSTLQSTPGVLTAKQSAAGCINPDDWSEVTVVGGVQPPGIYHNGLLYDTVTKKMILYGGTDGALTTAYGQTWAYDVPTHQWTQKCTNGCTAPPDFQNAVLQAGSSVPKPSWAYSTSTHKIYLHQDSHYQGTQPSDWVYDPAADTWTQQVSAGVGPSNDSFMAYDPGTNHLVTMGQTNSNRLDMWQSSLATTCSITPSLLPGGVVGTAYSQTVTTSNCGAGPFTWSITSGSLPPGLNGCTGGSCTISGTPNTISGSPFSVTLQVTDGGSNTASQSYSMSIVLPADTQPPTAPTGLSFGQPTSSALVLSWTAASDNVGVAGYRLDVAVDAGFASILPADQNRDLGNVTSVTVNGLLPGTAYYARLRAYDAAGNVSVNSLVVPASTSPGATSTTITLPIEVIGADGLVESVTVPIANPAGIDHFWVRAHALDYADKGSLQINSGAWIPINNNTVQVADPGKSFGGIGGALSVLEFTVPIAAGNLVSGNNVVNFRFNHTDGVSSGFRVLAFNFYQGQTAILPSNLFVQDQPSTWLAPSGADPIHGNALFWTAQLINSPLNNSPITATCRSCHSNDGRDLQYFSFSNKSIIARSVFHGLSPQNGADIAAFIRTLPVSPAGRPWSPPFQPGPGLDSLSVTQWSAGQGFGAVLSADQNAFSALFPSGQVSRNVLATSGTLNLRELPINLLLPDWNHWLPRTAPVDIYGSAFNASNLSTIYQQLRTTLTGQAPTAQTIAGIAATFQTWATARKQLLAAQGTPSTPAAAENAYATALWQLTKSWELMHEFNMENFGTALYGTSAESRSWFIDAAGAAAPDALGIPRGSQGLRGGGIIPIYLSLAWMQVQAILTPNRSNDGFVNWPLLWTEVRDLATATGISNAMDFIGLFTKAGQVTDNNVSPDQSGQGWAPDTIYDLSRLVSAAFAPTWTQTPSATRTALLENITNIWLAKSQQYTRQQYLSGGHLQDNETPVNNQPDGRWVDRMWYSIPLLGHLGVSSTQMTALIAWVKTLWPDVNWDQLLVSNSPVTTGLSSLNGMQVFPNPWRKDKHEGKLVTFNGLPSETHIKLFSVSGHLVKDLGTVSTSATWDLTNDSGEKVASGIYIYLATDPQGDKARGKVAVIR